PDKCGLLQPGEYKWEVSAQVENQVSDNSALYDATTFTVVSEKQAKKISSALQHASMILRKNRDATLFFVTVLFEHKLYPQAESELLNALEHQPANQPLWTMLIETYAKMKRWRTREKARELSLAHPTIELIHTLGIRRQ